MDSSGASTAVVALAAVAAWEGIAVYCSAADPVPFYSDKCVPAAAAPPRRRFVAPPLD